MTVLKLNLNREFKTVEEGERILEITDAKVTPSGKPDKLVLHMKDVEDNATLINNYNFNNDTSMWAMGIMLNIALGIEDGGEFDTKNVKDLVGIKLLCEVAHSEYNGRVYANVKKVMANVTNNGEVTKAETSTVNDLDEDDDLS